MKVFDDVVFDGEKHDRAMFVTKKELAALLEVAGPKRGPKSARVLWVAFGEGWVSVTGRAVAVRVTSGLPPAELSAQAVDVDVVAAEMKARKGATHFVVATAKTEGTLYVGSSVGCFDDGSTWEGALVQKRSASDLEVEFREVCEMWSAVDDEDADPKIGSEPVMRSCSVDVEMASTLAKVGAAAAEGRDLVVVAPLLDGGPLRVSVVSDVGSTVTAVVQPLLDG